MRGLRVAALALALCLTGPALAQTVVPPPGSSLATPVTPANGGSGVANTGNWTWNHDQTFVVTSGQTMTFPASSASLAPLTSPSFTTPSLGVATATSLNGNTFTTGTYTLTGTAAKTLNFTNTLTLSGTDSTIMTFPAVSSTLVGSGLTVNVTLGSSGAITTGAGTNSFFNVAAGGVFKVNGIVVAHGDATVSCTPPSGASGSPVCAVTHTAGTLAETLTFSGGTGSFTGTTMTITMGAAAPSSGYLCSGRDMTGNLNVVTTAYTSTTVSTLTFYNAAGAATPPGLTDVVTLACTAE